MSIIHEALKKVQDKLTPAHRYTEEPAISPVPTTQNPRKTLRLVALLSLPILTVFSLWFFYQQMKPVLPASVTSLKIPNIIQPLTPTLNKQTINKKPAPATEQVQVSANSEPRLQGIFKQDNSHIALINDKMYQIGDKFNEMNIVSIEDDKVYLSGKDNSITLQLQR